MLAVRDLSVGFASGGRFVPAIDQLSFSLERGKTLGIVGESGSGKSLTALALMRLLPPNAHMTGGEILLAGEALHRKSERAMREIRGAKIAMIFQDPMTALNPVLSVGEQIAEVLRVHRGYSRSDAWQKAIEALRLVDIPDAAKRAHDYPHHFSGGMRQRVLIAMALACEPDVLIADEPTTALDVTIQAQILALMQEMQARLGMALLIITHDLGVVAQICDEVLVMYGGAIVEYGRAEKIFSQPAMPYTHALLASLPRIDGNVHELLATIDGQPPRLSELPSGCVFAPRCPQRFARCAQRPPLFDVGESHLSRCWLAAASDGQ